MGQVSNFLYFSVQTIFDLYYSIWTYAYFIAVLLGLQSDLTQLDKSLKGTSYISAPWFDMYLSDRQPLPINYNPALVFVEDPVIDSLPKPRRQLTRTTNLLVSALR